MKYEVRRGPIVVAHTEHESCVDSQDKMLALMEAGHSIYIDGKRLYKKDISAVFSHGVFSNDMFKSLVV